MDHNTEIANDGLFSLDQEKPRTILPFSSTIQDKQDEMLSIHISQDVFSSLLRTASLFWFLLKFCLKINLLNI